MPPTQLLEIDDLRVTIASRRGMVHALDGVSLSVAPGEIVGIAGESGCGKSTLCLSVARTLPSNARTSGTIRFEGDDLMLKSERAMRRIRGRKLTMILQNPLMSLDPVFTIGSQIRDVLTHVATTPRAKRADRAIELLREVGIPAPEQRLTNYPHQLSGGMRQRVVTALATASRPRLLLADEPTTALDVTIQEQILDLFRSIRDRTGCAILIVTHDLGIIRRLCDRAVVMYAGRIVEQMAARDLFDVGRHPYTKALLAALPKIGEQRSRLTTIEGNAPDLIAPAAGCAFSARCSEALPRCPRDRPDLVITTPNRAVACHLYPETH